MKVDDLLQQHAVLVTASAISDPVARARGYRSVTTKAELRRLGFSDRQAQVPALLIPVWGIQGEIALYQARPDEPRIENGRAVKYETPRGARMTLDIHPSMRSRLADPRLPLYITEGIRKADAAASIDLCCIALLGVWNFRGTNEFGGTTALPEWESIALNDRLVYIVFDSDVMTKREVHAALARLRAFLESRGAQVRLIYLPAGPGGAKVGLDDFIAHTHGVDDLLALASSELRAPVGPDAPAEIPYRETPTGLIWDKPTANGSVAVRLTNYTARIVANIQEDDGVEQHRLIEIEAAVGGRSRFFRLAASAFERMSWPTEYLGPSAVTYAGLGIRDHARVAIQLTSGEAPERTVFTHLGWRDVAGTWMYLHGGGAIGPVGSVAEGIETNLDPALGRYVLPDPPSGPELVEATRASLRLLEVAPDRVSSPLLGAIYRVVLGATDVGIHLSGRTGVFKTALAALAQQHFGAAMDSGHLPGSWASTANALEALAFAAQDALFVVDDFAPAGSASDVLRLQREAERYIRAQGNRAGRQRMRADTSLRPAKWPRGLTLSTGEDVPRGQSLRARLLVLEVEPDDITTELLTASQADASAGLYAAALSGFIRSIAGRYGEIQAGLRAEVVELRGQALRSGAHRRTPEIVANLALGIRYFLNFTMTVGAITTDERATLWRRCWAALGEAAAGQAESQAASDPTVRFVELLASALARRPGQCCRRRR